MAGWNDTMKPTKSQLINSLDTFTRAYLECALWSSSDESRDDGGDPLDENYELEDCTMAFLQDSTRDCQDFRTLAHGLLTGDDAFREGMDFWLTRNGHGAGYWDGDYPEHGDALTKLAKRFPGIDLYVSNGLVRHI